VSFAPGPPPTRNTFIVEFDVFQERTDHAVEDPLQVAQVANSVVRGQYVEGKIDGEPRTAYRLEPKVRTDSSVETFVAARLLIDKGADVNARDQGGNSVLATAANANNLEVARLLIGKGAQVNTVDGGGYTPLLNATGNGDRSAALVKLLLEKGAQVNVKSGETAEIVKNGPIQIGRVTPLHNAAGQASAEAVEALLKAGANVEAKDVRNVTPLVWAVATDHANPSVVRMLLSHGAARQPAVEWARRGSNHVKH